MHIKPWLECLKVEEHCKNLGVDGRNIKRDLRKRGLEDVDHYRGW
jgi:hypothetical protein